MMSTPFGPQPPVQQPKAAEVRPEPATPATAPPVQPPAIEPVIRSLTSQPDQPTQTQPVPTQPGQNLSREPILDPRPSTPEELAAFESQADDAGWWQSIGKEASESKSLLPTMLLAFGVMLAMFFMMRMLRRKQSTRPIPMPVEDRISAIHEMATSTISPVERAMSDAEQLARRLAATMENKAARLELLIEEADRKLEELNRAVSQASRTTPERTPAPRRTLDPTLLDRARVEQDRAERNGHHEPTPLPITPTTNARAEPTHTGSDHPSHADPVHRRIWALADDGMPPMDIARSLNQPVGQVELILNLRKSG